VSRIKVLEVLDGSACAYARAQAAAVRDGLDPAAFDAEIAESSSLLELRRLFVEKRPDAVHVHAAKDGAAARLAAKLAGVKKIFYTPRGLPAPGGPLGWAASRIGERVARDIYLGDFPEPAPHDDVVVGARGRMTAALDPDAWVLLVQRLTDSRNGIRCVWIGGGEDEAKTRTHLTNMNLLMKASVTGELPDEQARQALRGLDVFVRYARSASSPGAVLEAMAFGLPVVASDLPAHRAAVVPGETGFLVKTEVELLERCQELIDDADLRRRLGAAGRERVRREFSRERQLAELSRLYSA
jgi:glycosyltransferase involved in cell wall biosynthesis